MVDTLPSNDNISSAKTKTRQAQVVRVLTYYDGPQLILLRNSAQRFLAIAIPRESEEDPDFFATSVQSGHWEQYLAGKLSLRYLFAFPEKRSLFYFTLSKLDKDRKVAMARYVGELNPRHLPGDKLFASDHTEEEFDDGIIEVETLLLDGEWDLPELGKFQQQLSDIYNFIYSMDDWRNAAHDAEREAIRRVFVTRPFQGGSSYGAYFNDLEKRLKPSERVKLKSIEKASPGKMKIGGSMEIFSEVEDIVTSYIKNRTELKKLTKEATEYLRKEDLAQLQVSRFKLNDKRSGDLARFSGGICSLLSLNVEDELTAMTRANALGKLKIVLAIYRRTSSASEFFAQGRADFG